MLMARLEEERVGFVSGGEESVADMILGEGQEKRNEEDVSARLLIRSSEMIFKLRVVTVGTKLPEKKTKRCRIK